MAIIDISEGGGIGISAMRHAIPYVLPMTIDFAKNNAAQNDVVKLFKCPAGARTFQLDYRIKTLEGGVLTAHVGVYKAADDSTVDQDGLLVSLNLNNALGIGSSAPPGTAAMAAGRSHPVEEYIGLTALNAANLAKVTFWLTILHAYQSLE